MRRAEWQRADAGRERSGEEAPREESRDARAYDGAPSRAAVLIYDAECPVCRSAVEWVRANAPAPDTFEFLPCGSEEMMVRFPGIGEAACLRAVHLVLPDDRILAGEMALPEILRRLPRYRFLAALFRLPGARLLSRLFYRRFATHRYRVSAVASRSEK